MTTALRKRGRPLSESGAFFANALPEFIQRLNLDATEYNNELMAGLDPIDKVRRDILKHYKKNKVVSANGVRKAERETRLLIVQGILEATPSFSSHTASWIADRLAPNLRISKRTIRKYVGEIRKLAGPLRIKNT